MNKQMTMIATAALLGLPTLLSAQARVDAQATATIRAESRAETEQRGRAEGQSAGSAAVSAAAEAGLPEAPVHRTIAEGEAKGASATQVNRAALEMVAHLHASREALRDDQGRREPEQGEIVAGADALAAGATRADLRLVRDAAPEGRSLTASLTTLAELRAGGAQGGRAAAAVAAQLARGASDRAIRSLSAGVDAAAGLGASGGGIGSAVGAGAGLTGGIGPIGGALNAGAVITGAVRGGNR